MIQVSPSNSKKLYFTYVKYKIWLVLALKAFHINILIKLNLILNSQINYSLIFAKKTFGTILFTLKLIILIYMLNTKINFERGCNSFNNFKCIKSTCNKLWNFRNSANHLSFKFELFYLNYLQNQSNMFNNYWLKFNNFDKKFLIDFKIKQIQIDINCTLL